MWRARLLNANFHLFWSLHMESLYVSEPECILIRLLVLSVWQHFFFSAPLVFFCWCCLFVFYSSLVKTMDALSLFSFAVFSRLSGKAFLPSSCFRQAFFFNALSITHHPHFVPEQLFPFFVPLWWKHDSVLHLTWTDVNKYTPSSFFFCSCIPFVIYPLLSTPNSNSRYPSSLPPPSILFPPGSVNRGNLSRCSWNICVGSCLTHTEERRGENQGGREAEWGGAQKTWEKWLVVFVLVWFTICGGERSLTAVFFQPIRWLTWKIH